MHATDNFKITIWLGLLTTGMGVSPALSNTELPKTHDCTTIELEAVIDQNASREDNLERLSQQFFQSVNRIEHCDREPQTDNDQSSSSSADAEADASAEAEAETEAETEAEADASAEAEADAEANADASANAPAQTAAGPGNASTSPAAAQATPSSSLVGTSLAEDLSNIAAPSASNMAGTTPMLDPADMGTATSTMNGTMTGTGTGTETGTATDAESETAAVTARPQMQQAQPDERLTNGKIPDDIPDAGNDSVFEAQIRAAAMAETDPDTQKNLWNEYRRYKGLPEQE
ncbi:hypothetical protein OAT72_05385 [Alphaproteobacteria bacterium]|nr:hypothetical protein [Alphaproteobacteria bacterium]